MDLHDLRLFLNKNILKLKIEQNNVKKVRFLSQTNLFYFLHFSSALRMEKKENFVTNQR